MAGIGRRQQPSLKFVKTPLNAGFLICAVTEADEHRSCGPEARIASEAGIEVGPLFL